MKAIISKKTPLSAQLPAEIGHYSHLVETNGALAGIEAISLLKQPSEIYA